MTKATQRDGGCLCGAVRFTASLPDNTFNVCHCNACRKWSGGPLMAVHCQGDADLTKDEGLSWYRSSDWAERGFCRRCGSSLFWRLASEPQALLIVAADAFDTTDDLTLDRHIYWDAKPKRYDFADKRPRLSEAEVLAEFGVEPGSNG